ncbi:MAG: hypothetical protein WBA13_07435 [Microcoleaceae cyanobacterium]
MIPKFGINNQNIIEEIEKMGIFTSSTSSIDITSHDHDNQYKDINWTPGWDDLPTLRGTFSPYPFGTGWRCSSQGWWSRQKNHVIITAHVTITQIGQASTFQIAGLPFPAKTVTFCSCRVANSKSVPASCGQTGYVDNSLFTPQYLSGSNSALNDYSVDEIKKYTYCSFSAYYEI